MMESIDHQRHYFELIQRVGSWNMYQFYLFIILVFISILECSLIFSPAFLFNQTQYYCQNMDSQSCLNFVCSLPQQQRSKFLSQNIFTSFADDLTGDFRCVDTFTLPFLQTMVSIGSIVGMLAFSLFTEKIGRKNSLSLSTGIMLVGVVVIYLSTNVWMVAIGIFLTFTGSQNSYQYVYCFATEVVSQSKRILYINFLNFSYSFGMMTNPLLFYSIKNWKTIFLYVYIPVGIIVFLSVYFFVFKTPLDLLVSDSPSQIQATLKRIAWINSKQDANLELTYLSQLKNDYLQNHSVQSNNFTILHLFKYDSLRRLLLPLSIVNMVCIYLFYSPSMVDQSNDDLYNSNMLSAWSYMLSTIFASVALNTMGRKTINYLSNGLVILISLALTINFIETNPEVKHFLEFTCRFMVSIAFQAIFLFNYESFPTQVRCVGATFVMNCGTCLNLFQSWIISFCYHHNISSYFIHALLASLAIIFGYFMRETFGTLPGEVIEQLKQSHQSNVDQHDV